MNTACRKWGRVVWGIGLLAAAVIYVASIPFVIRGIVDGWFPDEGLGSHLVASYLLPWQTLVDCLPRRFALRVMDYEFALMTDGHPFQQIRKEDSDSR